MCFQHYRRALRAASEDLLQSLSALASRGNGNHRFPGPQVQIEGSLAGGLAWTSRSTDPWSRRSL